MIGSNRPRLYWTITAAQALGAIPVPFYEDAVAQEMVYVFQNAEIAKYQKIILDANIKTGAGGQITPGVRQEPVEAAVGLVLGGMLTTWASWRWGLLVNVPLGAALIWLAPRYLPDTPRQSGRFDLTGAITSTLGMTALVFGIVHSAEAGWAERIA